MLVRLTGLVDRVEGLRLRVMATAMDVAEVEGAPTVAAWLAPRTRATTRSLHGREQLARGLDRRWQLVGAGVATGSVSMAQAEVIVRALEALDALDAPSVGEPVDRELLAAAEQHLVEKAAEFTPPALRALGERILEVICPEQYDDQERTALLAAERRASAATRLSLHVRGDGSVDVRARVPEATAARLQTYLEAVTAPRRGDVDEADGARVPADQRRGHAFCALLEAFDPDRLPLHGGTATTVVVTVPYDGLVSKTGVATLGDGTRISASEARRLACGAAILPAVLDGTSEVLDLGRTRRLFSTAQRKALAIRQRTCRAARLHGAVHLVRSPPRRRPLVSRRPHRPRRRHAALLLAPPPHPRRPLPRQEHPRRRSPLPPTDVGRP